MSAQFDDLPDEVRREVQVFTDVNLSWLKKTLIAAKVASPKEAEKRERIYRWLDHVAEALTFNPDTETPGWIIPVIPDELDHPER